jgi:pimeloyl-ACP methyl ester carboxylesterase
LPTDLRRVGGYQPKASGPRRESPFAGQVQARETGTGTSAAREYWETGQATGRAAGQAPPEVAVPAGFTTFPGEIWPAPRSSVEKFYPTLTYFNEVDRGGHFAAWEEPELFATEIRAAFKSLR